LFVARSSRVIFPALALLVVVLIAVPGSHRPGPSLQANLQATRAGIATEVPADRWWTTVRESLAREEYHATPAENVIAAAATALQAPNRAHNLRTRFAGSGIEITPRGAGSESWRLGWRTEAYGRAGAMRSLSPVPPTAAGPRVAYAHPGFTEWYENQPVGLEQGFTLDWRPPGTGPLAIRGRFAGDLVPRAHPEGIDFLAASGHPVLEYRHLLVWDASGRELPARLELTPGDRLLAFSIDDTDASYPITVDPLVTSPSWIAESNQAAAQFASSVATAGDVNGDGYSDVIVGAPNYDNGHPNEGRAFVYLGSPAGLALTPAWTRDGGQANASFGGSAAPAGDVNADGFGDVAIGAFAFDNGQDNEGAAFLFLGSAAGLGATPAWTTEGNQVNAFLGLPVAPAGDVNGDGFADLVVGASEYDNGHPNEGRALVFHGGPTGLATSPAWTAEGDQPGGNFGIATTTAGDVNGDGFADLLVGAHLFDDGSVNEGVAFLFLGSAAGLAPTPAWRRGGNQDGALFGHSVATAGDVNGDGYADAIIGAELFDNGTTNEGRAFVFHGSPAGLDTVATWTAEGDQNGATFGRFVATAGDVNGDGFADVIVGAPAYDQGESNEGRAFVFLGGPAGLAPVAAWSAASDQMDANLGTVGTAGDVNGDGYSDVIAGALAFDAGETDEGRAFVFHGGASGLAADASWSAAGATADAALGFALAAAGDVNGDGYSDAVIGVPGYDGGNPGEGRALVYHGSAAGLDTVIAWSAEADRDSAAFGSAVAGTGDVNGDGYSDVIVGAPRYADGDADEGAAFVYLGSPAGLAGSPAWSVQGNQAGARLGCAVAGAGDVDATGFADVILGASGFDGGDPGEGAAFVYLGSETGLAVTPAWDAEGDQADAHFGSAVAGAGDLDGDGASDVVIGAPDFDGGADGEGKAFVFLGSPSGPAISPAWTAEGEQAGARFGAAVARAGDVDGDGYADLLAGAPAFDATHADAGRAFLYLGSAGGPALLPNWTHDADRAGAGFGEALGSAGDVNGDGFVDVLVGAPRYAAADNPHGRAYVFPGSSLGLATLPAWTADGAASDDDFGGALTGAGDVNGDGFADVLIGAAGADVGAAGAGTSYLYYGGAGDGLDRRPQQARASDAAPIDLLGQSELPFGFRLRALGRSPGGRAVVRLEWEVKAAGTPFDATGLARGARVNTGVPLPEIGSAAPLSEIVFGLAPDTPHHWRLRIVAESPFFPRSRWFSPALNGPAEADLRTPIVTTLAAPGGTPASTPPAAGLLAPAAPNPFRTHTELGYTVARSGRVRLAVYDVTGREVAVLFDGIAPAGSHALRWDGRSARGDALPAGVYFTRLRGDGWDASRKLVIAR
jgi:FG-GAP repeat/FG-GAP-like repeat